jgi:phosphoenolpyruvate-protein kinase (PTS system EI component)
MTAPSRYRGQSVSEGIGTGEIYLGDAPGEADRNQPNPDEDDVRAAFAAVARERAALAARLRERGQDLEADIVDIGALIAADSALVGPAIDAVRAGTDGVAAIRAAAETQAEMLATLPDPDLAQRAGDVRQVAAAVLDHLRGTSPPTPPAGKFILVRREVDPADLIQLADRDLADRDLADRDLADRDLAGSDLAGSGLAGAVSVAGGASSHAAIVARGLGLPMLAGADPAVLAAAPGHQAILDATVGELIVDPPELALAAASLRGRAAPDRQAPQEVRTADGEPVTLLCNVASAAETRLGLAGGAAGVGLLRTEIAFTGASGWPSQASHLAQLTPVLGLLAGRPAVVRLLDFSGDKVPPFLGHGQEQGLAALLHAPGALEDQLRAILRAGAGTWLAVLVPMVTSPDEVAGVRAALAKAAAEAGVSPPELGIMVEVASTAAAAAEFAPDVDFFSIGTNDLASEVLGLDRADPETRPALAADPRVLALIEGVVRAGAAAGVKVSVCGDAAADPLVLPLLLGLGVRTLSVGAARVPKVAGWIAATDAQAAARRAAEILAPSREKANR